MAIKGLNAGFHGNFFRNNQNISLPKSNLCINSGTFLGWSSQGDGVLTIEGAELHIQLPTDGSIVGNIISTGEFGWSTSGNLTVKTGNNYAAITSNLFRHHIVLTDSETLQDYMFIFSAHSSVEQDSQSITPIELAKISDGRASYQFRRTTAYPTIPNNYRMTKPQLVKWDSDNCPRFGKIVIAGDSIANGTGDYLQDYFPGSTTVNAGVGGDTIQDLIDRFATDIAAENPDEIILLVGANSMGIGLSNLQSQYSSLLDLCDQTGAKTTIIENIPRTGWSEPVQAEQTAFNAWLATLDYRFVKTYDKFLTPGTDHDLNYRLSSDGVHPSLYNSYRLLAATVAEGLGVRLPRYIEAEDIPIPWYI